MRKSKDKAKQSSRETARNRGKARTETAGRQTEGSAGEAGKTKGRETATGRRTEGDEQQRCKRQPRFQN